MIQEGSMAQVQSVRRRSVLVCSSPLLLAACFAWGGEAPEVEWRVVLPSHFADKNQDLEKTSDGGLILSAGVLLKTDARGDPLWETSFDGMVYSGPSIRQLKDGHYIVGGTFTTGEGMALIKVDPQGRILWQKAFGGEGAWGYAVEATADGGYAVTGTMQMEAASLYVVRTDGDGNLLWEATYVGADPSDSGLGYSLQETPDGGFIVAGVRSREGAILLKVDWQGNLLWEKRLSDGGVSPTGAWVVRVTEDGGYLLAGAESRDGKETGFLWKTDEEGNTLWMNRFPGPAGFCWLRTLDLTSDGGAVAVGTVQVLPPAGESGVGDVDVYLVRVNRAGELLWEKRLLTADPDVGLGVVQMPDGGYAVSTKTTAEGEGPRYATLIKLGPDPSSPGPFLRRGDVGGEGTIDLSDAILILNYLFLAGPAPPCLDASDADDDGEVALTDGIVVLQFLFLGGEPPKTPGPNTCGPDPTPDGLSCRSAGSCAGGRG